MASATVSSYERCSSSVRECSLHMLNLLDLIIGCGLLSIGIYLRVKLGVGFFEDVHTSWLAFSTVVLGGLLVVISFLSFCSIANSGCRFLSYPSGYLALLVALIALAVGSAALAIKSKVFRYLNSEGTESGLSSNDVKFVKGWYDFIAYGMFALFVLQILRFRASMRYREAALRIDGEFAALLKEEDKNWNEKLQSNKVTRAEKYDNLRAHYKAKYATTDKEQA